MHNKRYLILGIMVISMFTGCAKTDSNIQEVVDTSPDEVVSTSEDETVAEATIINPLKEVTREELLEETGISFVDEYVTTEPQYFVLTPPDSSEKKIAELRFTVGDYELTYRAQPTDKLEAYDMNGLYYEWDTEEDVKVSYCDAKLMKCSEAAGLYWIDVVPGINYSLSCIGDIYEEQFIGLAELLFDSNVDDAPVSPAYDYEGEYSSCDDENIVILTRQEDGTYSIEVDMYRLCSMEGEANDVDGAAEFRVTDPSDEDMYGVFYVNDDDTYTLMITESTWEYIKTGDIFEGYIRK